MEQYSGRAALTIRLWLILVIIGGSSVTAVSNGHAQALPECATVKECAQQMVAIVNDLREENAALLKRVETLEKLVPKWNGTSAEFATLKKALSEPAKVKEVKADYKKLGKCGDGQVMVGWEIYNTPDAVTVNSKIHCATVFGDRP